MCLICTESRKESTFIGNISDLLFNLKHTRKATIPHRLMIMYNPNLNEHVWEFDSDLKAIVCDENWSVMKEIWAALMVDNNKSTIVLFAHEFGICIHSVNFGCCTLSTWNDYHTMLSHKGFGYFTLDIWRDKNVILGY